MWLNDNPFHILNAKMGDSISTLITRKDELSEEHEINSDALAILRNPKKRIAAEIRWPWEAAEANREALGRLITSEKKILPNLQYSPLCNINVLMQDLELYSKEDIMIAVHTVEKLDELYSKCDPEDIATGINKRREAGFPKASTYNVEQEIVNMIEDIKKTVTIIFQGFSESKYYYGVRELSKTLEKRDCFTIFSNDVIVRYELYVRKDMDELQNKIRHLLDCIKTSSQNKIMTQIDEVNRHIQEFWKLSYPMIAKAKAEGRSYDYAIDLFWEFRNTYIEIYNERDFYYEAQQMADILIGVMKINCSLREKVCEDLKQML